MKQSPPILEFPGPGRAVIEPRALMARKRPIPEHCVLCFFVEVLRELKEQGALRPIDRLIGEGEPNPIYELTVGEPKVAVVWPGLTAPYAAAVLEELIALGGRWFVACGGAGVLDRSIAAGHVVIPTAALRDEGTSYHYLRRGRYARPHPAALSALRAACRERQVPFVTGKTWTTDAVYRETPEQVQERRAEGCLTVEMEAAAFFAVARFRGVVLGQYLYGGDDVSGEDWDSRGWRHRWTTRRELFELAVDACRRLG